jgi:hypothetical protein
MTTPSDSSGLSTHPNETNSPPPSEPSTNLSYSEQKEKLLLEYQDKALAVLETMKEVYPSFSVLDGQNVFLILLGLTADQGQFRKLLVQRLSYNLDDELRLNGILPEPEKQENSSPLSETA